jgi:RNA polymerase sigma-70 factor (ECF subfamily)
MNRAATGEDDRSLIEAFIGGDARSFDRLVLAYKDRVFNVCYRLMGDYEEANDCAQDTFIKVFRSLKRFRFEAAFSTWLYRIAVNTCKSRLSSRSYRHSVKMVRINGMSEGERGVYEYSSHNPHANPGVRLERKEREKRIQWAINSLPHDQKLVVVLRDVQGLSYEEVSAATGFNLGTVKSKLSRAREKLKDRLKDVVNDL